MTPLSLSISKRRLWIVVILGVVLLAVMALLRRRDGMERIVLLPADGRPCADMPTFTDPRDGIVYRTVQIGHQCWLAENLRYLPAVFPGTSAPDTSSPRYFVYDYQGTNVEEAKATENYRHYGVLYNWCAAMTAACPPGWHVPSDAEWSEMANYLIDHYEPITARNLAFALKSCRQAGSPLGGECNNREHPRWSFEKEAGIEFDVAAVRRWANTFLFGTPLHYGTDAFSFAALPAGRCCYGAFQRIGDLAYWWSSTEASPLRVWNRQITAGGMLNRWDMNKAYGYSVRCVRD